MWALGWNITGKMQTDLDVTVDDGAVWECGLAEGPARGLNGVVRVPGADFGCDWPTQWVHDVADFQPDLTILMPGAWDIFDREVNGTWLTFGSRAYDRYFQTQLARAISILTASGGRVVFMSSPPFTRDDSVSSFEPWGPANAWRVRHLDDLIRASVAGVPGAYFLDYATQFCAQHRDTCDSGRFDGVHYTQDAADTVNGWIVPNALAAAGLR